MNALQFIADLVRALAWPATIIIALVVFRRSISQQLLRLESLHGPGGWEAKFVKEKIKQIREQATALPALPQRSEVSSSANLEADERIEALLDRAPREAILEAWREVEEAVSSTAARLGLPPGSVARVVHELGDQNKLPMEAVALVDDLQGLRNSVAQSGDFYLSADNARVFVDAAKRLIVALNAI
jgi:uncharacterized protein YutE (UPF0331/DUF86 family)